MILVFIFLKNFLVSPNIMSCKCLVHHYLDLLMFHIYLNRVSINKKYEKYPRLKILKD